MLTHRSFSEFEDYILIGESMELTVSTLGATLRSLKLRGQELTLGYKTAEEYLGSGSYLGAVVGRFANRLGKARFPLNGETVCLSVNERGNQLHGGDENLPWNKRAWSAEILSESSVAFTLHSPAGDNGYPGSLTARVVYTLKGTTLRIDFYGETDADTLFAPTTHTFFDLDGREDILTASLQLNASQYLVCDEELIPTGEIREVEGKYDLRTERVIGENLDTAFVLDGSDACTLHCGEHTLTLRTDFPALQVYTGEFLDPHVGKNHGIALEPEHFPDAPNHPNFPDAFLRAGERYHKFVEYDFT